MITNKTILLGFYQGLGDFVSAVPVINQLLEQGNRLIVVASKQNLMLAKTIKFRNDQVQLIEFSLFSIWKQKLFWQLFVKLSRLEPEMVFVSPHAQKNLSSWKLSLLLAIIKKLFWKRAVIFGAEEEKLAYLFNVTLPVDKKLDLLHREWSLHTLAGTVDIIKPPDYDTAITWAFDKTHESQVYDLIFHPGASKDHKKWPIDNYVNLVKLLGDSVRVVVVGLKEELEPMREGLGQFKNVNYFSGSIADVVTVILSGSVIITMDSGFSHIAAFLGVNHIAVFGASSPFMHGPLTKKSKLLFNPLMACQPCNQFGCRFNHAACMETITSELVYEHLAEIIPVRRNTETAESKKSV